MGEITADKARGIKTARAALGKTQE
jgi:hypothetical protein